MKGFDSRCIHDQGKEYTTRPHSLPIYASSSFEFDNIEQGIDIFTGKIEAHKYSRYGNPTVDSVGQKIADLETFGTNMKAWGIMCSSGMSAISTACLSQLSAGDKILTQGNLYGGTTELFQKMLAKNGIKTLFTNLQNLEEVENILKKEEIKILYFETPANPTMACIDIEKISKLAKKYSTKTIVDNTFMTPYLQRPLTLGVDMVVHSTTKFLNGHGNSIAGVIIGHDEDDKTAVWTNMKLLGTNCSPFEAWLVNNGIKTLSLRMDRHCDNAMSLANYLAKHPKIKKVNYNGLKDHQDHEIAKRQMSNYGGMMSFEIAGGIEAAKSFLNKVKLCSLAPTLGDVDTLLLHPATSSHLNVDKELRERNGISDGLIRVSVGIENIEDLLQDFEQALS